MVKTSASTVLTAAPGGVVHQLGDGARTDRADIACRVAHPVQHRLVFIECCLVAADPDRQAAAIGPARPAADRRIEEIHALLCKLRVQRTHDADRVGGQIEPGRALAEALDQAVVAGADCLHVGRSRQRGEHKVRSFGHRARAFRPGGAVRQMPRRRLARQIVHHQLVAGLLQVAGHPGTHHAEPDETDLHRVPSHAMRLL